MHQTTTITVRLPTEILSRLNGIAQSTDRTKSYLACKAIEDFVNMQEWQVQAIKQAVTEADEPDAEFHKHDEVVARIQKKIQSAGKTKRK